jgi:cytochrome c-type biogenesis protein CcmH/NrfF
MIRRLFILVVVLVSAGVSSALAAQPQFSMDSIQKELMCPVCGTRLDMSQSPAANEIRAYVEQKRAEGWTKHQVEQQLVAQFGPTILASTPTSGRGLVAWLAPILVVAGGLVAAAVAILVWSRRARRRDGPGDDGPTLSDADQQRVTEALARFDGP